MSDHKYTPEEIRFIEEFAATSGKALGELLTRKLVAMSPPVELNNPVVVPDQITVIKKLGDVVGYGHLMAVASALWRHKLKSGGGPTNGAFVPALMCDVIDVSCSYEADCAYYDKLVFQILDK